MESKYVTGYDDYYTIYEDGTVVNKYGKTLSQQPMKITKPGNLPYMRVKLTKNYVAKDYFVHRLVAQEFIPNDDPEHKKIVMHLDNNCQNNNVSNLKWGTDSENCQQRVRDGHQFSPTEGNNKTYIYFLYNKETDHTIAINGIDAVANKIGYAVSTVKHMVSDPDYYIQKGKYEGYKIYRSKFMLISDKEGNLLYLRS